MHEETSGKSLKKSILKGGISPLKMNILILYDFQGGNTTFSKTRQIVLCIRSMHSMHFVIKQFVLYSSIVVQIHICAHIKFLRQASII